MFVNDRTWINNFYFIVQGTRRQLTTYPSESGAARTRSLIKRSDILQHIKHGNKLLEDAEETKHKEEEITKGLGDYTVLDLQSELMEMTVSFIMKFALYSINMTVSAFLTHYHNTTFNALKIHSCGKHCEKRRNCL